MNCVPPLPSLSERTECVTNTPFNARILSLACSCVSNRRYNRRVQQTVEESWLEGDEELDEDAK